MAVNHFGTFYLTYLLFDLLKNAKEGRIINTSSSLHYNFNEGLLNDFEFKNKSYGGMDQYQTSKFANVLFTQELSRRLSKYPNLKTACLHPGIVNTNLGGSD